MKKNNLTVVIYTYNEEKNIRDCINSAKLLTDNIVLIDLESADQTAVIAGKSGAIVYPHPHVNYVEPVREFGIGKADTDWVFILDADERITEELADEILNLIEKTDSVEEERSDGKTESVKTHYKIPRKNIFGGKKWLKYGGWWQDNQIRLINKKHFIAWPTEIHSTPQISGNHGLLHNPLIHFFHGDFENMVSKTVIFEDIESDLLFKAGKNVKTVTFFRKFLGELIRRSVGNLGFLDGQIGIIESIYQAFSKTITYLYLYEKRHKNKKSSAV